MRIVKISIFLLFVGWFVYKHGMETVIKSTYDWVKHNPAYMVLIVVLFFVSKLWRTEMDKKKERMPAPPPRHNQGPLHKGSC